MEEIEREGDREGERSPGRDRELEEKDCFRQQGMVKITYYPARKCRRKDRDCKGKLREIVPSFLNSSKLCSFMLLRRKNRKRRRMPGVSVNHTFLEKTYLFPSHSDHSL